MTQFICKKCNYRFESKQADKKCPYCGENSVSKEKSAEELIAENDGRK